MRRGLLTLVVFAAVSGILGGCAGVVVGAGATAGVAAFEERGIKGVASDTATAAKIRSKVMEHSSALALKVGIEVYDNRVLLTGIVADEKARADAVKLAWSVKDIDDVLNELMIGSAGILDTARDGWISTQLFTRMTGDEKVLAINYSIETVNGVVYLIGLAQSQAELDRVVNHARDIEHVRRVVSHVRVKKKA